MVSLSVPGMENPIVSRAFFSFCFWVLSIRGKQSSVSTPFKDFRYLRGVFENPRRAYMTFNLYYLNPIPSPLNSGPWRSSRLFHWSKMAVDFTENKVGIISLGIVASQAIIAWFLGFIVGKKQSSNDKWILVWIFYNILTILTMVRWCMRILFAQTIASVVLIVYFPFPCSGW